MKQENNPQFTANESKQEMDETIQKNFPRTSSTFSLPCFRRERQANDQIKTPLKGETIFFYT